MSPDQIKRFEERFINKDHPLLITKMEERILLSFISELIKETREETWNATKDKIESIVAEFGDDPKGCLAIISEYFQPMEDQER